MRDMSLVDLDRAAVLISGANRSTVVVESTCEKAVEATVSRALTCWCNVAPELHAACPACLVAAHILTLDAAEVGQEVSYPPDAPHFPQEDGQRPSFAAMAMLADAAAKHHGLQMLAACGARLFGRHSWRRSGAAWLQRATASRLWAI